MRKNEENMTWMDIPYITLTFCLRFYQRVAVPENKVSALRGGLGEMLLRKNCIADRDCEACRFQDNCMVWNAFYTPMRLKPGYVTGKESLGYLIECDNLDTLMDEGHGFVFRLKLFGRNIPLSAQYLDAFWRLGQCGLGKEQAKFEIAAVYTEEEQLLLDDTEIHMEHFRVHTVGEYIRKRKWELSGEQLAQNGDYLVHFLSPLALRKDRIDLKCFDAEAIWRAIHRKIQMMSAFDEIGTELEKPQTWPQIIDARSAETSVRRYSSTHRKGMELSGVRGYVIFEEVPEERLEELLEGELFHIGRNNSFDFGRYVVQRR